MMLRLAAAATVLMPSVASAATFVETQAQTVNGQDFVFSFTGAPAPTGAGTLEFLVRGDFSIGASLGESFAFTVEGILTDAGIQATSGNVITSFVFNDNLFNDNLFQVSYGLNLAQLTALAADNTININVDYADGVNVGLSGNPFIRTTLNYASADMGAVPEPGTWAMMLIGFGFVGGAMRSRRKQKLRFSYA